MPSESPTFRPGPPQQHKSSLESQKEVFKKRLAAILNEQLTVDNIETFADHALSETVELTDDVLKAYRENPELFKQSNASNTQEQENEAFEVFDLPNIQEILQSIIDVKEKIDSIKKYIGINAENVDKVITPPQENHDTIVVGEAGNFERKRLLPRLLTLLYIIEHDFDIPPTEVKITEGIVKKEMVRKTSYARVEIPGLERVVYICDEEGNASYVFDAKKLEKKGVTIAEIDEEDKGDKNSLIARHPGIGIRIIQSKNWRDRVAKFLGEPIPEKEIADEQNRERKSEFRKKEWLPFQDFQAEVINAYPGQGNVAEWYKQERKNHNNWPFAPYKIYKNKGWIGWPELVGRENRLKKEYLSFESFRQEVQSLYSGQGNVERWYWEERKKHSNWPSRPYLIYKNQGWIDWSELVGKENLFKKEFLSFEGFQQEVQGLYSGQGDIKRWYTEERKKHPKWPSLPGEFYKNKGWIGWPELVGRENRLKKEYLSFESFRQEVSNI
jgi:hypothetical protein